MEEIKYKCEICNKEATYECSSSLNSSIIIHACKEHQSTCLEAIQDLNIMKKIEIRDIKNNGTRYSITDMLNTNI